MSFEVIMSDVCKSLAMFVLALTMSAGFPCLRAQDSLSKSDYVTVRTKSEFNRDARIHYRVPEGWREKSGGRLCRVLVYFGGRNCDGAKIVSGNALGLAPWADENAIFIVAPSFKDDDYWEPGKWSGEALMSALKEIKRSYPICLDGLFYYGYSAGSQCANLFPAWRPNLCRAWVSHACGVFFKPSPAMRMCPGLVTCGDADEARYVISRRFVYECRRQGVDVLWKSFPNHPHDVPPDSVKLAIAFLTFQHKRSLDDLVVGRAAAKTRRPSAETLYVGDDQEGRFFPAKSREALRIDPEDRVAFANRELALAWGREAFARKEVETVCVKPQSPESE